MREAKLRQNVDPTLRCDTKTWGWVNSSPRKAIHGQKLDPILQSDTENWCLGNGQSEETHTKTVCCLIVKIGVLVTGSLREATHFQKLDASMQYDTEN